MNYLYNSKNLIDSVSDYECPIANQTMLIIFKEQIRKANGIKTNKLNYISLLDSSFLNLETKNDSYEIGTWVNLNLNYILKLTPDETIFGGFDDRLDLFNYLDKNWKREGVLFIDCKTHIIDKQELKRLITCLELKLQDKISYGVQEALEKEQICEDDCNDYYAGVMEACRI